MSDVKPAGTFIEDLIGDEESQVGGIWIKFPETQAEFKIIYSESKVPRDYYLTRLSKARRKAKRGNIPPEVINAIVMDLQVNYVLKGWRGMLVRDQETQEPVEYEFNQKNARALLTRCPSIQDFIATESGDPENFGMKVGDQSPEGSAATAELKSGPQVEA